MNNQIEVDAREFGLHLRQGGWRMGLLVARNVERKVQTENLKRGKSLQTPNTERGDRKQSVAAFAKSAGTSQERVALHLDAWNAAAEAGLVPHADTLNPGDEPKIGPAIVDRWKDFYSTEGTERSTSGTERSARALAKTDPELVSRLFDTLPSEQQEMVAQTIAKKPEFAKGVAADDTVRDELVGAVLGTPEKRKAAIEQAERDLIGRHPLMGWQLVVDGFGEANLGLTHALDGLVKLAINARVDSGDDALGVARGRAEAIGRSVHEVEMAWGETPITDKIEELRDRVRS